MVSASGAQVRRSGVCRYVEVVGMKCRDRGRKTLRECVNDDMKLLGLQWAIFRDIWRDFI